LPSRRLSKFRRFPFSVGRGAYAGKKSSVFLPLQNALEKWK